MFLVSTCGSVSHAKARMRCCAGRNKRWGFFLVRRAIPVAKVMRPWTACRTTTRPRSHELGYIHCPPRSLQRESAILQSTTSAGPKSNPFFGRGEKKSEPWSPDAARPLCQAGKPDLRCAWHASTGSTLDQRESCALAGMFSVRKSPNRLYKCREVFLPSSIEWLRLGYDIIENLRLSSIILSTSLSIPC